MTAPIVDGMLQDARRELENGDRIEASEKVWEAIEHALKAVAARRGWKYDTQADGSRIIMRLVNEMGDDRLQLLFSSANSFYRNYYIDAMPIEEIHLCLAYVDEFIAMLDEVSRG